MPPRAAKRGSASNAGASKPASRSTKSKAKAAPVEVVEDDFSDDEGPAPEHSKKARQPKTSRASSRPASSKIIIPSKPKTVPISDEETELPEAPPAPQRGRQIVDVEHEEEEDDQDFEMIPAKPLPAFMTKLNPSLRPLAVPAKRKEPSSDSKGNAEKRSRNGTNGHDAAGLAPRDPPPFKDPAARLKAARVANRSSPVEATAAERIRNNDTPKAATSAGSSSSKAGAGSSTSAAPQNAFMPTTTSSQPSQSQHPYEATSEQEEEADDDDDDDDEEGGPSQTGPDPQAFQIPVTSAPRPPATDWKAHLSRLGQAVGGFFELLNGSQSGPADPAAAAAAAADVAGVQPPSASASDSAAGASKDSDSIQIVFPYVIHRSSGGAAPARYSAHLEIRRSPDGRDQVWDGTSLIGALPWSSLISMYVAQGHFVVVDCLNLYLKRMSPSTGVAVAVVVECNGLWAEYIKRFSRQCYVFFYKNTVDNGLLMRLEFENFCKALQGRFPQAAYIATEARHDVDIQEEFEQLEDAAMTAAGLEPEMDDLFRQMQQSDAINGADALSTLVGSKDALLDVATLPFLPNSTVRALKARGLKTELKSHQSQGVTFMVRQEHPTLPQKKSDPPVGLWKKRKTRLGETYYQNIANSRRSFHPAHLPRGGILADGMGLGKTLQVLALVLADPTGKGVIDENFKGVRVSTDENNAAAQESTNGIASTSTSGAATASSEGSKTKVSKTSASRSKALITKDEPQKKSKIVNAHKARKLDKLDESYCKTTLIVCPLSVVVNWQQQIEQHCDLNKVSYYVLHGDKLRDRTHDLSKYDFVIVTYDTIKTEFRQYSKWREAEWAREVANRNPASDSKKVPNKLKLLKDYEDEEENKVTKSRSVSKKPDLKGKGKAKAEPSDVWSSDEDDEKVDYRIGMEISDESDDDWDSPAKSRGGQGHVPSQLFERKWRRLILDEGHVCRNPKTRLFEAMMEIQAERIWTVTGTPIVNSTRDLQALVSFLKLAPLDDPKAWTRLIDRRIKKGQKAGLQLLQIIIRSHTLRRTKSMEDADGLPLVPLPKITIARHAIELDEETREYYDEVEQAMKDVILNWIQVDALNQSRGHVLVFLSRLRQLACHRNLVPRSFLVDIKARMFEAAQKAAEDNGDALTEAEVERLQEQLVAYIEGNEECPICIDVLTEPRITYCGHVFCLECIRQTILANPSCPMDRRPLPATTRLIAPPVGRVVEDDIDQNNGDVTPPTDPSSVQSAKIEQLVLLLQQTQREDNEIKSLVFSNFVGFLDHIAVALKKAGITYCRFDGSMTVERRNAVLEAFSRPNPAARKKPASGLLAQLEEAQARKQAIAASKAKLSHKLGKNAERDGLYQAPRVMLLSIGSGALGLNLVQASQVFLMDPWWQSAIEAQAIDRVHRIGQNRAIRVVQMIVAGTVEERVLEIQKRKEDLIKDAFSSVRNRGKGIDVAHQERETRGLADLIALFGIGQAEAEAAASSQDYL